MSDILGMVQEYLPFILGGLGLLFMHRNGMLAKILGGLGGILGQVKPSQPSEPNSPAPSTPLHVPDLLKLLLDLLKARKVENQMIEEVVKEVKGDGQVEKK